VKVHRNKQEYKEVIIMNSKKEKSLLLSRRNFITKAGIFLAGGIAGNGTALASMQTPTVTEPPLLPWKWVKLDPMEAGRRAYRSYLEKKEWSFMTRMRLTGQS
jgi:hypothetical protein